MSDPCDSRRSIGTSAATLTIEAETHAGGWQWLAQRDEIVLRTAAALAAEIRPSSMLTAALALSDDAAVRALNRQWRQQDKPTNVLSFPAPPPSRGHNGARFLGDIVLAEETLLAEARAAGIPAEHHFQHLLVHGLLHLMGYDHEDDREATTMEALETRVLDALGVPDPYAGTVPVERIDAG